MGSAEVLRSWKRRSATIIVTTTRALKNVTQLNISMLTLPSIALPNTLWIVLAKNARTMKAEPISRDCLGCACMSALIATANLSALDGIWQILAFWLLSPHKVFLFFA